MRVLYLNPSGAIGGAERSLLDIIASLRAACPEWQLSLIAGEDGALVRGARALGATAMVLPIPEALARLGDAGAGGPAGIQIGKLSLAASMAGAAMATRRYARSMAKTIVAARPTVIHTNGFKMHLIAAQAAGGAIPIIWHVHDYVSSRPVLARLMRLASRRCAIAIANSRSVQADFEASCPNRPAVATIYNAVDLGYFSPCGRIADLDALAGITPAPAGTVRVGLVATLARWKGHEVFLGALAALPPETKMRGYVIGDAIYSTHGSQWSIPELRAIAERLGVAARVGFTGFVEDVASAIRGLDVVVHASTEREPFGLAIAEAMACGKPVIASRAGGAVEIVEAGAGALMHRPGDSAGLAERIAELARDSEERSRLGSLGRTAAERLFTRSRLADELIAIYERVLGASI
ncbi:MAG TPA: glycosyltransferase family 4 protein [Candidatus Binataceae bacterium]|nr:glycosyltransferase family 4 protein [Candidatus Binataceae bacterium]